MKNQRHRIAAVLSLLISLILFLPTGLSVEAREELTLEIPLRSPIEYTSKTDQPTDEESAEAQAAIRSISQTAYDAFLMDHPLESMWIDVRASYVSVAMSGDRPDGNLYRWKITSLTNYLVSRDEFTDPKGMTQRVKDAIESFTPTGDTLYEKVLSIHDFVCASTVYDKKGSYAYNAYGALVDGRSVCEGYAEAFKLLCDRNGIGCVLVSGTGITSSGQENHMWNYVLMDDGRWYAVDATWDDGKSILRSYFLVGSQTVVNSRNGKRFSENHVPNGDISRTGLKTFEFPSLATNAYVPASACEASAKASSGQANRDWFADQLGEEHKNFYDRLLTVSPPKGDSMPPIPTKPAVTTTEETTTAETTTTSAETTTAETTTAKPDPTTPSTTKKPPETEPLTTEKPVDSTTETTAESSDDETVTEKDTDGETLSPDTEESTVTTPSAADGTSVTTESDTPGAVLIPDAPLTSSQSDTPESTPTSTPAPSGGNTLTVGEILRTFIIILTLVTIFLLIILIVIRLDHKTSK